SNIKIPTPKGKIPVMGILESRNLNFNIVFIPAMNDNLFPPTSKKDIFLNTEIRQSLDLPTIADRESLMKNYLLQIMERSKLNVILYSSASSAQNKSRFLEEITVYGNITEKSYSPSEITLFKSNNIYFSKNDSINIDKNDNILKKLSLFTYSATSLNTYLKCPLSFYFQFVKNVSPEPTPEKSLSSLKIGNAFHKALERLNKEAILPGNKNYRKVFKYEFSKRLMQTDAFKFNATEQFKAELSADVIDIIAERELERLTQGWQLKYTERNIDLKYNGYNLKGFIDRIDSKDNCHEIIDYKFKSNLPKNDKPFTREKSTDLQMPLYALLFELDEGVIPENLYYFDLKQTINLINAFNMEYYDEFKADFLDLLNEINSDNTPFYQTNKADSCKNCPYSGICGRNS
ncbi:MAG: PD-(D/E)XK nuclease family protein, partial [Deferribacterales bacterium]|nr:PD-(D/E)XK nuclease family protein [Deferribacterales bacterium]